MHTPLVVGDKECAVCSLNGAILGVIPPGAHTLSPESFPFLGPSIDGSSNVNAELWFVTTSPLRGLQLGGSLGTMYDGVAQMQVSPRAFGDYSLTVVDPVRFVQASMGMADVAAILASASQLVMNALKEACGSAMADGQTSVANPRLLTGLMAASSPALRGALEPLGLAGQIGNLQINLSDEDRNALVAANAAKAKVKRDAVVAQMEAGSGSAPAQPNGGASAIPPLTVGTQPQGGGTAAVPAGKRGAGLFIGLGVAGLVVIGVIVVGVLHFTHAGSPERGHEAAQHEAKHGKH